MTAILNVWRQIENPTPSIDAFYVKSIPSPTKFYPDPIWNDGAVGFYEDCRPQQEEEEEE